jgi:hypothetical protein
MMGADTTLGQALARYLEAVKMEIQNRKSAARPADARLAVLISDDQILRRAVEHAEKGQEFQDLVREAAAVYYPKGLANDSLGTLSRQSGEFFRLSGIYCDLFDGRPVRPNEQFARFKASLEAQDRTVTYYAPIEWVYFGNETIRFGEFEIRRLRTVEMEAIFSDRVRRIFYPWARVSAAELDGYWFLIAKETKPVDPPGKILIRIPAVDPHRPRFSAPIDRALSLLALGDWATRRSPAPDGTPQETVDLDTPKWPLPELVPFVISVSTNCLEWPRRPPDASGLSRDDDGPNFQVHWDAAKADEFEQLLASALRALDGIRPNEPHRAFVDVALRFLGTAFTSQGIESLLWGVTTLDALLGENERGAKARLSARLGKMLGEAQKAKFEVLYEMRSDLVHGNEFKHEVLLHHLGTAREFARLAALWMLSYLAAVALAIQQFNCPVPDRTELLAILDGDTATLNRHKAVADALPKSFPKVKAWLGPVRHRG